MADRVDKPNSPGSRRKTKILYPTDINKLTLAAGVDRNISKFQQHTFKIGYGYFLYYFLGTTSETQLVKAAELFHFLNVTNGIRAINPILAGLVLPPDHSMSDGSPGYIIHQVTARHQLINPAYIFAVTMLNILL
jgi:hypothetical protein